MDIRKLLLLVSLPLLLFSAEGELRAAQRRAQKVSPLADSIRAVKNAPSAKSRAAFSKFAAKQGSGWKVRYSAATGLPEALTGGRTARYSGAPEQAAVSFLQDNKDLLNVSTESLRLALKKSFLGVTHVQYQQYYKGIPVEFSYARVHVTSAGSVTGYQGRFDPSIDVNTVPAVGAAAAKAAAMSHLGEQINFPKSELVIYPDETSGSMKLAWKLRGRSASGLWVYYVDAADGAVLFRYDDLRYAACPGSPISWNTVGSSSATVYAVSPLPAYDSNSIYILEENWSRPVKKSLRDQYVWVGDYSSSTVTSAYGDYCTQTNGKMFSSLKGPYFNVTNFRGASAHYDNGGGTWMPLATQVQTPHPYSNSSSYSYNVSIADTWSSSGYRFAKAMPRFSSFKVGEMDISGGVTDPDQAYVKYQKDGVTSVAGAYTGARTASFYGASVESPSYTVTLESDASGVYDGFTVDISSYLVLTNSPLVTNNTTGSVVWSTSTAGVYMDTTLGTANALSEVNAFYHLNSMHRFFDPINLDTDGTPAADLSKQVTVMVHAHGNADKMGQSCGTDCGGMLNAFYDLEHDNIMLGDGPLDWSTDNRYRSFALDGTIVRHEYIHLVINRIYPMINFGEFGAISEGLSDYFSLASFWREGYTTQTVLGNFIGYGEASSRDISGSNNPTTSRVMPGDWYGEVHEDGLILSQSLYELGNPAGPYYLGNFATGRFSGRNAADVLAFAALFYFPDNFSNYRDAMLDACSQLGDASNPNYSGCTAAMRTKITTAFSDHGIGAALGGGDQYETSGYSPLCDNNNGPECSYDASAVTSLSATIYPLGDVDYYSLPLAEGSFAAKLDLPAGTAENTYKDYALFLFDADRNYVTEAVPAIYNTYTGYCPDSGDCLTTEPSVTLTYSVPTGGGRYYLVVAGGPNKYYGNSDVNSLSPYTLTLSRTPKGSASARMYSALYDNDEISFDVPYSLFAMTGSPSSSTLTGAETVFEYAQLRDHNYEPIELTKTSVSSSYLQPVDHSFSTATDSLDRAIISGRVRLQPGFAARYPGVGTVYLEVFGRNHLGNVLSLGVSGAINLTANRSAATAYNNIISGGSSALIKCELQASGSLAIKVYTQTGALVKTVYDGPVASGKSTYEWDGTNSTGGKAASGIYFVKIKGPGLDKLDKIAVVR